MITSVGFAGKKILMVRQNSVQLRRSQRDFTRMYSP